MAVICTIFVPGLYTEKVFFIINYVIQFVLEKLSTPLTWIYLYTYGA